ncbi:MAG: phospholipid carrier-dependent glycosyltransferase, partial [Actinobacteria bacterium]
MGAVAVAVRERRVRARVDAVLIALGALVVLAAVLRFTTLSDQSYWLDESVTALRSNGSFYHMLAAFHRPGGEAQPPLYFVLAWFWARVFGTDEFGLRSLSAVCGVLTVPVAFEVGRTLVNRRVGLVVAALVTVSPAMIWYSQEARAYALFLLLSAVAFLFFVRLLESPRPVNYVGWSAASSLALVTHYFALFPLVGEVAWLLLRRRSRETVLAVGGICLAGLLIFPIALYQKQHGTTGWITWLSFGHRLDDIGPVFVTGVVRPTHDLSPVLLILFACAVALVMASGRSRVRRAASIGLAVSAVTIGLPLLGTAVGQDYFFYRYLLPAWIPVAVAVA